MDTATGISGVPGCGKSTEIKKIYDDLTRQGIRCICVTMTSFAADNLIQNKHINKYDVKTLENSAMTLNDPVDVFLFDEATMIRPYDILPLLRCGPNKIYVFGDPT